jgi:glycosyltransferase involved in cell wall biosynthesis
VVFKPRNLFQKEEEWGRFERRKKMKFAYIKYGDVVEELKKIGPAPATAPKSGPLTFIGGFLRMVSINPALLISWDIRSHRNKRVKIGRIEAFAYRRPKGMLKIVAALNIFAKLIAFRPRMVLCVHDGPGLWAALAACHLTGATLLHSRQRAIKAMGDSWRRRLSAKIDSFVIRQAAGVICHGPFTRHQLIEIGVPESRIVEFDVRLDGFMNAAHRISGIAGKREKSEPERIFFLGRVEPSKGVFELLEACIPLLKASSNLYLTFVGQGAALPVLQNIVKKEGLISRIAFTGAIPHDQMAAQLGLATALVTPTRRGLEGWPMAALEGMAMGVPVIAPAAGPFLFMIKDGRNGLLYKPDSVTELRKKIKKLLDDPVLRQKLAFGAIETSAKRTQNIKDFGEALRLACERWV